MPAEFIEARAAKWVEIVATLRAQDGIFAGCGDLIRLYCIAWTEAAEARAHVDLHGQMVPQHRTGAPIANPYRAIAVKAEATVAKLAGELGLTPTGRRKLRR